MKMQDMATQATAAAELLATMANPARLLILCSLVEGEKTVGALVMNSGISQSAVSQHLAKLRNLKLVNTRRDAQSIYYSLAGDDVRRILTTLYDIFCRSKPPHRL